MRLRQLAPGHAMEDFLRFVAKLSTGIGHGAGHVERRGDTLQFVEGRFQLSDFFFVQIQGFSIWPYVCSPNRV